MDKKTIIVTGASRGLGFNIIKELSKDYNLIATSTTLDGVKQIKQAVPNCQAEILDLNFSENVDKFCSKINTNIYGLINNAGVSGFGLFLDTNFDMTMDVFKVNFFNTLRLTQNVVKNNLGSLKRIINISSASTKKIKKGMSSYSSSKSALEMYSKIIAKELVDKGILVNNILPGYMDTDMTSHIKQRDMIPMERFANVSEISSMVEYLLSDKSSYITGQSYIIDGGLTN